MFRTNVLKSINILHTTALFRLLLLFHILIWLSPTTTTTSTTTSSIPAEISLNETLVVAPKLRKALEIFEPTTHISARSYVCVPLFRVFNLELRHLVLANDELVAITGDHSSLGHWQLSKAVPMKAQNKARTKWYLRLWICASQRFYYRYLIYAITAQGERVLRRWEGQQVARMFQSYERHRSPTMDIFGEAYERTVGGSVHVERGWLQQQYVLELKFVWSQHLSIAGIAANERFRLKLSTLELLDNALIEISHYGYNRSMFRPQSQAGVRYSAGAIVIFRVTQALDTANTYRLAIYYEANPQQQLGESYIFPMDLRGSRGILKLPIYSSVQALHIGELALPYLIVQPMPKAHASNLKVSFQRYWPTNWPTMDVGHRGLGASFYNHKTKLVENTIASSLAVLESKGDMVQLDVQLTRDYVPIVWHGFGFYTAAESQLVTDRFDLQYVLIRELSYAELKSSRVFITQRWSVEEYSHLNVLNTSQPLRLFPKLSEVYQELPKRLGLIVDIKWPQLMETGIMESTQTLNKNAYVDKLIDTTTLYGCGRPLIFASFDADICTMLRLKQHAFPVLLMSIGKSRTWDAYMDLRTQSFHNAVNFAESAEILGTVTHVDNFVEQPQKLINLGLDLQQVVFLWGSDLSDVQLLEQFRAMDASGLIYDHIELFGPADWKRAPFFKAPQLLEVFGEQCVAIGNSTTAPGFKPPKPTIWPKQK